MGAEDGRWTGGGTGVDDGSVALDALLQGYTAVIHSGSSSWLISIPPSLALLIATVLSGASAVAEFAMLNARHRLTPLFIWGIIKRITRKEDTPWNIHFPTLDIPLLMQSGKFIRERSPGSPLVAFSM